MTDPIEIPGTGWEANSYIVDGILVDAGVTPDKIVPYKDQIKTIVATHGHFDHIAHLAELANLCNAEIAIGAEDAAFLSDDSLALGSHVGITIAPITPDRLLHDGDTIGSFTVYHTPGHTRGSICLFRKSDGMLISGDTLFAEGSYGRCDLPTGSIDDMKQSIERLAALPVNSLWCGHGMSVPEDAFDHVLASWRNVQFE